MSSKNKFTYKLTVFKFIFSSPNFHLDVFTAVFHQIHLYFTYCEIEYSETNLLRIFIHISK